jgi:hypothetical protein
MALSDEVQNRWSSQILINAFNPQDSTATSLSTGVDSKFALAIADVEAGFEIYAGTTYDNTKATHKMIACEGVLIRGLVFTGQSDLTHWDSWINRMRDLGLVTGRDRIKMYTDSTLSPTRDRVGSKPSFDSSVFTERYVGNAPVDTTNNEGPVTTD